MKEDRHRLFLAKPVGHVRERVLYYVVLSVSVLSVFTQLAGVVASMGSPSTSVSSTMADTFEFPSIWMCPPDWVIDFMGGELQFGMAQTALRRGVCEHDQALIIDGSQETLTDALWSQDKGVPMPAVRCVDVVNATNGKGTAADKHVVAQLNAHFHTRHCVVTNVAPDAPFVSRLSAKRELLLVARNPAEVAVPAAYAAFGFYDRGGSPFRDAPPAADGAPQLVAHYRASIVNTFASIGLAQTVSVDYTARRGAWSNRCGDLGWASRWLGALGFAEAQWCVPRREVHYRVNADSFELTTDTVGAQAARAAAPARRALVQTYKDLSYYNFYVADFVATTSHRTVRTWADALNALMATLGTATFWLALLFVVEQTRDGKAVTLFKYRDAHQRIEEFKETARGFHGDLASKAAVLQGNLQAVQRSAPLLESFGREVV